MKEQSLKPDHWTDEQLIEYIYGVRPDAASKEGRHLESCEECRRRVAAMQLSRRVIEAGECREQLSADVLIAQRRAIYQRIEQGAGWRTALRFQKWAPAACALLMLGGGFVVWEHRTTWMPQSQEQVQRANISDDQLVQDASQIANDVAPDAAAPLHALFEN